MKLSKKWIFLIIVAILLQFLLALCCWDKNLNTAYAGDAVLESSSDLFNDREIESSGYLYNYDDSADYVYIDFVGEGGYAIFANETFELMEYSLCGDFPYSNLENSKKYYGGPNLYFSKNHDTFQNLITDELTTFTKTEISKSAEDIRNIFLLHKQEDELSLTTEITQRLNSSVNNVFSNEPSSPPLDEKNWINPTDGAKYIENSEYFLTEGAYPCHGSNNKESCTAVATQLLLSYHNYYNDRRIIGPEHLYGGWNASINDDVLNAQNYTKPNENINVCVDPATRSSRVFGSTQAYHDYLYDNGVTGWISVAAKNLKNVLNARSIDYSINMKENGTNTVISSSTVLNELSNGYPVVLATSPTLNGTPYEGQRAFPHSVIAYGYQTLAPYQNNSNSYLGYIVHMGWDDNATGSRTNIWTNSSWYYAYMSLHINHTHNYEKFEAGSNGFTQNEYRCIECKHRCSDAMALKFEKTIHDTARVIGVNFPIQGTLVVPSTYNGLPVTLIDKSAFANQVELIDVTLPASIESIEIYAFENCTNLDYIEFKKNSQLYFIGGYAFRNCKLGSIEVPDTVASIGYGAFEGCAELSYVKFGENSKLNNIAGHAFKNCKSLYSFNFPKGFDYIGPETFFGCGFNSLDLKYVSYIGERAFANCTKLRQVYAHKGMYLENYAFENCNRLMNINCINGSVYIESTALANCPEVTIYFSPTIKLKEPVTVPNVKNCTFNQELSYIESFVKSSSNPSNLRADNKELTLYREGYTFGGWYTNPEFTGDGYTDVTTAPNGTLYARWQQIDACVAKGTLITLADGRQVPVESLTGNEQLLVWNMWTGKFDSATILFIDKDAADVYEVISLIFSDGTTVKVISEHAFWDFDLNRYVFLRNDAIKYIGHTFNKQSVDNSGNLVWNKVRLMDVNVTSEVTEAFSPVTYSHLCYYVNGMLSMPGATEGLINIFEVDKETMKFDSEKLAEDIDNYGLFTYEELAEILPVTEEVFYAFNAEYLKVAIGKGCIDIQTLANLLERYGDMMRGLGME